MMLFAIVGGIGSLRGAIIAAVALTYVTTEVTSLVNYQFFIFGGTVLIALFVRLYLGGRSPLTELRRRQARDAGGAAAIDEPALEVMAEQA